MVEIIQIPFLLQRKFMECVETIKSEDSIRSCKGCWEPSLPQKLCSPVVLVIVQAFAVVNIYGVDTRSVKNHETR